MPALKTMLEEALALRGGIEIAAAYKGQIEQIINKLKAEKELFERSENGIDTTAVRHASELMDELTTIKLSLMHYLCLVAEHPLSDAAFLDDEARDLSRLPSLEDQADDVFVTADGDKIRVLMPRLPHKRKPDQNRDRWLTTGLEREIDVWVEAVRRGIRDCGTDLAQFKSANIYILFTVAKTLSDRDNDNHETTQLVSKICGELPCGNDPSAVRIILDAFEDETFPESTFITIAPHKNEAPDNKTTLVFWKNYFTERPFVSCQTIEDRDRNNGPVAPRRQALRDAEAARQQMARRKKKRR